MGDMHIQRLPGGVSFEEFWASLMELKEFQKETALQMKETDRKMRETDRQIQETDLQMKETDRKISRLGDRLGELIEHLTASNLSEKFEEFNYKLRQFQNVRFWNCNLENRSFVRL